MTKIVSAAAFAASKALALSGHAAKRSHVSEAIAALLGYSTYAALAVEEQDDTLAQHLDDAEFLVLDRAAAERRANALGLTDIAAVLDACAEAIKDSVGARALVYDSVDDFYDSYCREALAEAISSSDDVSAAMSETNAYFGDDPELPDATPETANLWSAKTEWSIEASGDMHGSHDLESDRMFTGDTLSCRGRLTFAKAGRAGLISTDSEGYAGVDDSWQTQDRDDEAAYLASLPRP